MMGKMRGVCLPACYQYHVSRVLQISYWECSITIGETLIRTVVASKKSSPHYVGCQFQMEKTLSTEGCLRKFYTACPEWMGSLGPGDTEQI